MLTHQQRQCMLFIEAEIDRTGGVAPSLREIAKKLRRGKTQIERMLVGLEERGIIRRLPHRARAIEVLRPQSRIAFMRFDDQSKSLRPYASAPNAETAQR
jgi:repressor LexA